jgi:hypothetical protein
MPSPIYQNTVNLIVLFPLGDIQVNLRILRCGNILLLTVRFLNVAKFTTLTPVSLLISCKISFPNVGLKISSLPTLALKFNNFFIIFREFIVHVLFPHRSCSSYNQFYPLLGHEHSEQCYHTSKLSVLSRAWV